MTRVLVAVYAIAGRLAGVGGVLLAARLNAGISTGGTGYELNARCLRHRRREPRRRRRRGLRRRRRGDHRRHAANGGNLKNIDPFYLQLIIGALILVAVAFDQYQARRSRSS